MSLSSIFSFAFLLVCQLIRYLLIGFQIFHKWDYTFKSGKSYFLNTVFYVCLRASVVIKGIVVHNRGILKRQHECHQFRVLSADAFRPPSIGSYNSTPALSRPGRLYSNTMPIYTQDHCTLQRAYANTEHI